MKTLFKFYRSIMQRLQRSHDAAGYARSLGVQIGPDCKIASDVLWGTEPYLIRIGQHCEIASEVRFVTHDGGVWVFRQANPTWDVIAPIQLGNNVYIGARVTILPGVRIGDNCVVGAGSIVTKDVRSGKVVAGIPARILSEVDDYKLRCAMQKVDTKTMSTADKRRYLEKRFASWHKAEL